MTADVDLSASDADDALITEAIKAFNQCLIKQELPPVDELVLDGQVQRFGDKKSGWYTLEDDGVAIYGTYGNWKQHEPDSPWDYFEYQYGSGDTAAAADRRRESTRARQEAMKSVRELARRLALEEWKNAQATVSHQYLDDKQVNTYDIRVNNRGLLVIPFRDPEGTIHTLQRIDAQGKKSWLKDGAKTPHYFKITGKPDRVFIAEGYATCATIREATGSIVIMAGDKGNMGPVSRVIRAKLPDIGLVIAADIDAYVELTPLAQEIGAAIVAPIGINGDSSDFNDLAKLKGLDEVRVQLDSANDIEKPPPEPLRRIALSSNQFPIDALGPILTPAVLKIQEMIQAPLAMCGQSVLAGASLALQGLIDIEIDGRRRPVSGYFLTVGCTGERKTAVDEAALAPHRIRDRELYDNYLIEKEAHVMDLDIWNSQKKNLKSDTTSPEEFKSTIKELGPKPVPPLLPFMFTSEPTVEGLTRLLSDGRPSMGVFSDEGGMMVGGYSFSKEKALHSGASYSKFWDGGPVDRVRGSEEASKLYGRRVALHLMLQPNVAGEFLRNDLLADQGFLTRCLACYPESTVGNRPYREIGLDDPVLLQYNAHILSLLKRDLATEADDPQVLQPRAVTLNSQAKQLWREFHDYCDAASARGGEYEPIRGFANKAPEHAIRIAAILTGVSDPDASHIDLDTMRDAIQLTNYYLMEWMRIMDEAGVDPDIHLAETLLDWLKDTGETFIYPRKIYQYGPNSLRNKKDTMRIMEILEGHAHVIKLGESMKLDGRNRKDVWRIM